MKASGTARLQWNTQKERFYVLEGTADFGSWAPLSTNLATTNEISVTDQDSTNFNHRFYRVYTPD